MTLFRAVCLTTSALTFALHASALEAQPTMAARIGQRTISLDRQGVHKGTPTAPVWIVEFADFGCGYCAKFAKETMPVLDSLYTDVGKVQWRFIPFVLGMFPNAKFAVEGAICADEQRLFWPMHDRLYEHRKAWMASKEPRKLVARFAAEAGVNAARYASCVAGPGVAQQIEKNNALAEAMQARGTPLFVINGEIIPGALPTDVFVKGLAAVWQSTQGQGRPAR